MGRAQSAETIIAALQRRVDLAQKYRQKLIYFLQDLVKKYTRGELDYHEYAQIVDFDLQIFQDEIFSAVRTLLPEDKREIIDSWKFNSDFSNRRYA